MGLVTVQMSWEKNPRSRISICGYISHVKLNDVRDATAAEIHWARRFWPQRGKPGAVIVMEEVDGGRALGPEMRVGRLTDAPTGALVGTR